MPAHQAVIHQYMREMMAACGTMILGSDSHTRYGALGTIAIGEGGGELAKQLLSHTYDIQYPQITGVYLKGSPRAGVGPQDVALVLIKAVFKNGFVKNKILEFVGPAIKNLSMDFRNGIDVMTTETTCLSSVWVTDETVHEYFKLHGRENAYKTLEPQAVAYYDSMITIDLDKIEPMIALPFHPSNVFTIKELCENPYEILKQVEDECNAQLSNSKVKVSLTDKIIDGKIKVDQCIIAGCAGGMYENLCAAADILDGCVINNSVPFSAYPASQPVNVALQQNGISVRLMASGVIMKTAFCGPCFGAGDVPANNALSIRHTTRNFPSREGSKPFDGQISSVALMDARSIAATARNGGFLTAATDLDVDYKKYEYNFNADVYKTVYSGYGEPQPQHMLKYGPNIADWPVMSNLTDNLLLKVVAYITDPVTTTDELIPSGETSSYRSNPLKLAEFTLSRKEPQYVIRAKEIYKAEVTRLNGGNPTDVDMQVADVFRVIKGMPEYACINLLETGIGSVIYANKPGDGSAREQAASCQKVLGGWANIATQYATKRYRSNLINWGMLPFIANRENTDKLALGDYIFIPNIKNAVANKVADIQAYIVRDGQCQPFSLVLSDLTDDERNIILAGCLINYYRG